MRRTFNCLLPLACLFGAVTAPAQTPPAPTANAPLVREALEGRQNQKIERLRHEDAGNRIEELRVGGRMHSITVQPKLDGAPAYEVRTTPTGRSSEDREVLGGASGRPLWRVLNF